MKKITTTPASVHGDVETSQLFDNWFDPLEMTVRQQVRGFIETMLQEELETALNRPRYGRVPNTGEEAVAAGHRHGNRTRQLMGTFGKTEICVPRARLDAGDGRTTEWKSTVLPAYQRRSGRGAL